MPKIEQGESGPVVKNPKGESLDLTDQLEGPEDTTEHGDTARAVDSEPALVDTSGEPVIKTEGDKLKEGYVSEVIKPGEPLPTAGELRKAGYVVPDHVKDKEIPSSYEADTPTPPGEVRLVWPDVVEEPDTFDKPKKSTKAVTKAPKNK